MTLAPQPDAEARRPPDLSMWPRGSSRAGESGGLAAGMGGSWALVAAALAFLAGLVLLDTAILLQSGPSPFEPRPYLFLNLILSTLAALQAPVVLIFLSREARRGRERAARDDEMNLKVGLEIAALNEKIEALRDRELADVLAHQVELLQELRDRPRSTAA